MRSLINRLIADDGGQDLIEYALLTTVIALASVVVFDVMRGAMNTTYGSWETGVNDLWVPDDPSGAGS